MVEVHVSCTLERTQVHTDNGETGRDEYHGEATLRETRGADAVVEFPDGHVNLEAFLADEYHTSPEAVARSVLGYAGVSDDWTPDAVAFVRVTGGRGAWLQQAERYIEERPDMTVPDALDRFQRSDVTDLTSDKVDQILNARA